MSKIVVALGGNALGEDAKEQLEKATVAAKAIADLIEAGNDVVVVHGNGPQVGQIRVAFETASEAGKVPFMPMPECAAMSQGYIGYHLQQALDEELVRRGKDETPVVAMLTQVVVDENDPAFSNPTKPIGGFLTEDQAKQLMAETGDKYIEDSGRGWRRVVPSPKPVDIYEKMTLKALLDNKQVVIACGGGGIPVVYRGTRYYGIDAVIDKDFAAAKLAQLVDADILLILTAVDRCCIHFGKPEQEELGELSLETAQAYLAEGHFGKGSMEPKVQAAINFVQNAGAGTHKAIIGSLEKAAQAISGESGTVIQ